MSCSINKLKPHMFFICKTGIFSDFTWKKKIYSGKWFCGCVHVCVWVCRCVCVCVCVCACVCVCVWDGPTFSKFPYDPDLALLYLPTYLTTYLSADLRSYLRTFLLACLLACLVACLLPCFLPSFPTD